MSASPKVVKLALAETSGNSRKKYVRKPAAKKGVVECVRKAFREENRLATMIGVVLGGFVPMACFVLAHLEIGAEFYTNPKTLLLLGGLVFSAKTVYQWGKMAFRDGAKAMGFVLLIEGVMVFSASVWLSHVALALLIGINAVATGAVLSDSDG